MSQNKRSFDLPRQLLEIKSHDDKCKTSFAVSAGEYRRFRALCKKRRVVPSDMIDLFIREINLDYAKEIDQYLADEKKNAK